MVTRHAPRGAVRRRLGLGRRHPAGSSPAVTSPRSTPPRSPASATWRRSSRTRRTTSWTASTTGCPMAGAATPHVQHGRLHRRSTSWDVVFDPAKMASVQRQGHGLRQPHLHRGRGAVPQGAPAGAGHHRCLRADAAAVRRGRAAAQGAASLRRPVLGLFSTEIDNFTNGTSTVGTTWPYQVNTLQGAGVPVEAIVPSEGMTGWADTWMMSSQAANPNCMLKWMAWMLTPEVQTQVAEYFGEAPANPKACQYLDVGYGSYQFRASATSTASMTPTSTAASRSGRRPRPPAATTGARPASTTPVDQQAGPRSRADRRAVSRPMSPGDDPGSSRASPPGLCTSRR